jgi:hypothetical protein
MANTVSAYMAKNNSLWSSNVAVGKTVTDLNAAIATASGKAQAQEPAPAPQTAPQK